MSYQHLLVAVDNGDDRTQLISKAKQLAKDFGARLSVVSVMQPVPVEAMATDVGMGMPLVSNLGMDAQWTAALRDEMQKGLTAACAPLGIQPENVHLVTDTIDAGVLGTAQRLGVDLIVLGHHQHQGFFARLFSHTDQQVVGKARCDVLTVALEASSV